MQRRRFLRSAASALPLAFTARYTHALEPTSPPTPALHVVSAGQDRSGETHSPGYTEVLFKTSAEESPSIFAIEHTGIQPGWGPPLHLHTDQDEWFYVTQGEVLFQLGERRFTLKPGDSVLGPRNIPHTFAAVGPEPVRMLITYTPAGRMEQFFRDTASLGPQQAAAVFERYGMKRVGAPSPQTPTKLLHDSRAPAARPRFPLSEITHLDTLPTSGSPTPQTINSIRSSQ